MMSFECLFCWGGGETVLPAEGAIKKDSEEFLLKMGDEGLDVKQLGLRRTKKEMIDRLRRCYLSGEGE